MFFIVGHFGGAWPYGPSGPSGSPGIGECALTSVRSSSLSVTFVTCHLSERHNHSTQMPDRKLQFLYLSLSAHMHQILLTTKSFSCFFTNSYWNHSLLLSSMLHSPNWSPWLQPPLLSKYADRVTLLFRIAPVSFKIKYKLLSIALTLLLGECFFLIYDHSTKLYSSLWLLLLRAELSVSFSSHNTICFSIPLHCILLVFVFVSSIKLARSLRTEVFYLSFHLPSLIYSQAHHRHSKLFAEWWKGSKH